MDSHSLNSGFRYRVLLDFKRVLDSIKTLERVVRYGWLQRLCIYRLDRRALLILLSWRVILNKLTKDVNLLLDRAWSLDFILLSEHAFANLRRILHKTGLLEGRAKELDI